MKGDLVENINTILITGTASAVTHSFTTESHAREVMRRATESCGTASSFVTDAADVRLVYEMSPGLREHVAKAKAKLLSDLRFKECLDRYDVPLDPRLRQRIHKAFDDYLGVTIGEAGGAN